MRFASRKVNSARGLIMNLSVEFPSPPFARMAALPENTGAGFAVDLSRVEVSHCRFIFEIAGSMSRASPSAILINAKNNPASERRSPRSRQIELLNVTGGSFHADDFRKIGYRNP